SNGPSTSFRIPASSDTTHGSTDRGAAFRRARRTSGPVLVPSGLPPLLSPPGCRDSAARTVSAQPWPGACVSTSTGLVLLNRFRGRHPRYRPPHQRPDHPDSISSEPELVLGMELRCSSIVWPNCGTPRVQVPSRSVALYRRRPPSFVEWHDRHLRISNG